MKPSSSWIVPASLALCAVFVIGSMAWITRGTLAAERERAEAEVRADIQERTRLALWRMDSLGAAILLEESWYPDSDSRLPVKLRFTLSSSGVLRAENDGALPAFRESIGTGANALQSMRLITQAPKTPPPAPSAEGKSKAEVNRDTAYQTFNRLEIKSQDAVNWAEQEVRSKAVQSTLSNTSTLGRKAMPAAAKEKAAARASSTPEYSKPAPATAAPAAQAAVMEETTARDAAAGGFLPIPQNSPAVDSVSEQITGQPHVRWIGNLLVLARRIGGNGDAAVYDGAWIDDGTLRTLLLGEAADLVPSASLIAASDPGTDGMVLASFPFRLQVPPPAAVPVPLRDSTVVSLATSWAAALIALFAILFLVRGVMRLSERRASFVSAVTHELRTPLTTFRLYSDMLESGAVREERRGEYLGVLTREADRLTHLVENVLAFSRIERGSARSKVRDMDAAEILDQFRERFETRLAASGLHLAIDAPDGLRLRADHVAVEHILFNLIDNAAKYAAGSEPPVVTITASCDSKSILLRVCDHGPGIPKTEFRRIFRAFHKSAHEAAESKPGVGLGLALSRRLARQQGGDLRCLPRDQGSCFELALPKAR